MTALIEGFFGFVWFGWGQANASSGLRVGLAVAGVVALLVAVAGGVQAFRSPASTGVLHDRQARRRYGVAVGVEFSLAGVGAAVLAVAGQGDFIPVWVCAVVGLHFFPLASLLEDRLLVALGVSLTTVALVALVAGLVTDVAPSTVTGIGAGTLLTVFGLAALAGVHAEGTSQLSHTGNGKASRDLARARRCRPGPPPPAPGRRGLRAGPLTGTHWSRRPLPGQGTPRAPGWCS